MKTNKSPWLMSIDAGTGGGKCFLINITTKEVYSSYQEWTYFQPDDTPPDSLEFDPDEFWGIIVSLIKKTIDRAGVNPRSIKGISSTCQREGMVFLNSNGDEIYAGPNIDLRTTEKISNFIDKHASDIYKTSGHWPTPMFAPYRLLWFKQKRPKIYKTIHTVLMINDWILYKLSGQKFSEPSNAVETLLFDLKKKEWDRKIIDDLGISNSFFPPIVQSGSKIGQVTKNVSSKTDLQEGTPVVTGGADIQCSLIGLGVVKPSEIGVALGSFAPVMMITESPIINENPAQTWSGLPLTQNYGVLESTAMSSGRSLRALRDIFFEVERVIFQNIQGVEVNSFQYMDELAKNIEVGSGGTRSFMGADIPNYQNIRFSKPWGFIFSSQKTDKTSLGNLVRATYESIAYAVRGNIERLEQVRNSETKEIRISGGCTKSSIIPQILADVVNRRVKVPIHKEATALGAAMAAGVGSDVFKNFQEATDSLVDWEDEVHVNEERSQSYQKLYDEWLQEKKAIYCLGD